MSEGRQILLGGIDDPNVDFSRIFGKPDPVREEEYDDPALGATFREFVAHMVVCLEQDPDIGELPVYLSEKPHDWNLTPVYRLTDGDFNVTPHGSGAAVVIWPAV